MVRYEENKLVIEFDTTHFDKPKVMRNEFLNTVLFVIGHLDEDALQSASRAELYNLTLIAEAMVREESDHDVFSGNGI